MIALTAREEWKELVNILKDVEKKVLMPQSNGDGPASSFEPCIEALELFQCKAADLGILELQRAARLLKQYAEEQDGLAPNAESVGVFSFGVNALLEQMDKVQSGSEASEMRIDEVMEILGMSDPYGAVDSIGSDDLPVDSPATEHPEEAAQDDGLDSVVLPSPEVGSEVSGLERLGLTVQHLGGDLSLMTESAGQEQIVLRFPASPETIDQIETLLSVGAPQACFAPQFSQQGTRFDRVLGTIKEFMMALSKGNCVNAQEVLLKLAEQQQQAGLYNEIGGLARDLHNSLRDFMETVDPHLKEMVEEKIPDTGNRLEHILELTENAANTTIDHVEAMQRRNELEQKQLEELQRVVGKLMAIGDKARENVSKGQEILKEISKSVEKNHNDLIVVLTAQDYQDLTGQIILKIIQLLNDLELKLVNVIRTFGVKSEERREAKTEELYGPAHKAKTEALHSQDDVDSLLAEFGF